MWLDYGVLLVFMLTALASASSSDARSRSEVDLHDVKVGCKPTNCPEFCPREAGGYYYYHNTYDGCLVCECGRPKGPDDCGEDNNPSICSSVALSEECKKNSTVRENCDFSCSHSGQLWWAAYKGNLEEVNTAIAAGANPTCQKPFAVTSYKTANMTALHMAALGNFPGVVLSLLEAGVDVNLQTTDGVSSTYFTSINGSIDALEVLIDHNADINLASSDGSTPLILASVVGQLSVAEALINSNAQIDAIGGYDNATALYYATEFNNTDIVLLLIEHNADVNIGAADGKTPLMLAAKWGQISIVKELMNANASLDAAGGSYNVTALFNAVVYNNTDTALFLIDHNANVNIGVYDETPLRLATREGQLSIIKALINANASLDGAGGGFNATALFYEAWENNPDIALLLIEDNADINIVASNGMTPLMWAALQGHLSEAKALINANANLDVRGGLFNATALYYAASSNNPDVALLLIEHNADVNIAAYDGKTPLIRAARWGKLSIAKALINANASLDVRGGEFNASALYYAGYDNDQIISLLIEHNADLNVATYHGVTRLMSAAITGQLSIAKALINANASLDITGGWDDESALHYAAKYDKPGIVLLLLQSGADTMIQNKYGQTPAALARDNGHDQLADLIESFTTATTTMEEEITSSKSTVLINSPAHFNMEFRLRPSNPRHADKLFNIINF